MAFGRLERSREPAPMSDINMTPLIDVMLVLLVIFMITAPLMTSNLKLDLPKVEGQPASQTPQALALALGADGTLHVGEERIEPAALDARLQAAARQSPDTEVHLRADRAVPYGRVAELIGQIQKAGLNRIAFVTEPGAAASAAR
jgi:biopolymer transport protein ExbD/biopolymer transport protein TolR